MMDNGKMIISALQSILDKARKGKTLSMAEAADVQVSDVWKGVGNPEKMKEAIRDAAIEVFEESGIPRNKVEVVSIANLIRKRVTAKNLAGKIPSHYKVSVTEPDGRVHLSYSFENGLKFCYISWKKMWGEY